MNANQLAGLVLFLCGIWVGIRYNRWNTAKWKTATEQLVRALRKHPHGTFLTVLETETGVSSVRLVGLLTRMEREGLIVSRPLGEGLQQRRLFKITGYATTSTVEDPSYLSPPTGDNP